MKIDKYLKGEINSYVDKNYAKEALNVSLKNLIKKENISEDDAKRNLSSLEDTIEELKNCKKCPGLNNCPNHIKGYVYYPLASESKLVFNYVACKKQKEFERKLDEKDSSKQLLNARMKDIDLTDKKRVNVIKWLKSFYDNYDITKENKGLYLHGNFGCGKTFLIAALLNELQIEKGARIEIVYFPELLRTLKDNFTLLDSKVKYLSSVDILLLDDIGAENCTPWSRDEILGTILQARMNNKLATFFTSNLNINELEKHLATSKDSTDEVKARRIIERIKQLTDDINMVSVNRRK